MNNYIEILKKDLSKLDNIIEHYKNDLNDSIDILEVSKKELTVANAQHVSWSAYYHQRSVEVKAIKEYMEMLLDAKHGEIWRKYSEKNYDMSDRTKEKYINSNDEYLDLKQEYLKIHELYEHFVAINESFKTRGYVLNNLTKLICTEHADWVIQ